MCLFVCLFCFVLFYFFIFLFFFRARIKNGIFCTKRERNFIMWDTVFWYKEFWEDLKISSDWKCCLGGLISVQSCASEESHIVHYTWCGMSCRLHVHAFPRDSLQNKINFVWCSSIFHCYGNQMMESLVILTYRKLLIFWGKDNTL